MIVIGGGGEAGKHASRRNRNMASGNLISCKAGIRLIVADTAVLLHTAVQESANTLGL